MAEKRQKKQAVKAFEKETFSKDKEVTGVKHIEHRQDNTFSVENQFSASEKPVSNLSRDANHGSRTRNATSGHSVQKSEAEAEKSFLKENSFMQDEQTDYETSSDSTIENKVHVRDTFQRSEEKGKYHKGRVQREHAHRERAKSENTKQSDYGDFQTKDATFSQGQEEEFTDKKYRRLLISRKRVVRSCRKQRTRCRKSGSMR